MTRIKVREALRFDKGKQDMHDIQRRKLETGDHNTLETLVYLFYFACTTQPK